ncbi:MAG TPA: hypothetical protein VMC03_04040, partial [Streptosporangiaceae bacterium]|nr:hypothetical protein [Streptosporangiaceae bacterium]
MNSAGHSRSGRLETAGPGEAGTLESRDPAAARPADPPGPGEPPPVAHGATAPRTDAPRTDAPRTDVTAGGGSAGSPATAASHPVLRHLALLAVYLAAGIAVTWPRATYLPRHLLPETRDVSGYVWDLWWTAHQVVHLSNPWFTGHMAAPVGIQLGFDTTMPLAG